MTTFATVSVDLSNLTLDNVLTVRLVLNQMLGSISNEIRRRELEKEHDERMRTIKASFNERSKRTVQSKKKPTKPKKPGFVVADETAQIKRKTMRKMARQLMR